MAALPIQLSAPISAETARKIAKLTASHRSLERVVQWALSQQPPRLVSNVIKQDEFTQDVVVPYDDELHLVYDST